MGVREIFQRHLEERRSDVHAFEKVPSDVTGGEAMSQSAIVSEFQFAVIREIILALEGIDFSSLDCKCPKMIASDEWHFLCAPHADKPRDCCAIDYMKHTIDSTSSLLLTTRENNPSKNYYSILRRLYRIYGHLYFHHFEVFQREKVNSQKFYNFLKEWGLFKQDMMIIPESVFGNTAASSLIHHSNSSSISEGTIVDLTTIAMQLSE